MQNDDLLSFAYTAHTQDYTDQDQPLPLLGFACTTFNLFSFHHKVIITDIA